MDYFPDYDGEHLYWVEEKEGKDRVIMKLHKYNIKTMKKVGTLDFTNYLRKFMPTEDTKHGICNRRLNDYVPNTGCKSHMRLGRGIGYIYLGLYNEYGEERTQGMNYFIIDSHTFKIVKSIENNDVWFPEYGSHYHHIYYSDEYFMLDTREYPEVFIYNKQNKTERIIRDACLDFENGAIYKYYRPTPQNNTIGVKGVFVIDPAKEKAKTFNQIEFGETTAPLISNHYCHMYTGYNNVIINAENQKKYILKVSFGKNCSRDDSRLSYLFYKDGIILVVGKRGYESNIYIPVFKHLE